MMDKKCIVGGEVVGGGGVAERMLKSEAARLEKKEAAKRRAEEEGGGEDFKWFMEVFKSKERAAEEALEAAEVGGGGREAAGEALRAVRAELQALNREVFAQAGILRPFDLRTCKASLRALEEKADAVEAKLLPKKRFGFKSKPTNPNPSSLRLELPPSGVGCSVRSGDGEDRTDGSFVGAVPCLFSDRKGERLRGEAGGGDVVVSRLTGCTLILDGAANTLTLERLSGCTVIGCPVTTSIIVDSTSDSLLLLACQQLRVHDCTSVDFYLHATTGPILEDSTSVRLAPAPPDAFPPAALASASLEPSANSWASVNDFNWLSPTAPSPNWSIIPEESRRTSWPK